MNLTAKNIKRMKKQKEKQWIIKNKIKVIVIENPEDLVLVKKEGLKSDFEEETIRFMEAWYTRDEIAKFAKVDIQRIDKIRAKYKDKIDLVRKNEVSKLFQDTLKNRMNRFDEDKQLIFKQINDIKENENLSDFQKFSLTTNLLKLKDKIENSQEKTTINLATTWKLMWDWDITKQKNMTDSLLDWILNLPL